MASLAPRLLADVGGTNARFGWQRAPGMRIEFVQTLAVADHADLAAAAGRYLSGLPTGAGRPRAAALAVATAVRGDQVFFTNSPWSFSRRSVEAALGIDRLQVLNDFEAQSLALPHLAEGQIRVIPGGPDRVVPDQLLAVVGPGTGLGVGAVVPIRGVWQALPGEGGHATLAPCDELESEVLDLLRRELGHVSAERLLSGVGLPKLHRALLQVFGEPCEPLDAAGIVGASLAGDRAAARTLDVFCAMLGSFAGNVALTLGARGGLFVGGGIVPRISERFFASRFRERFEAKGRFQTYLRDVPTLLIVDTLAALTGAAVALDI